MLSAISIHSLRMEGDGNSQTFGEWLEDFNPLPPHGGRQLEYARPAVEENFNPLPPHGGRPIGKAVGDDVPDISIHSLRMEGDSSPDTAEPMLHDISIHSLRMEGDNVCDCPVCIHYISIHSLRMEGDIRICDTLQILCISIHSLRMEGDYGSKLTAPRREAFQSTPSAWRETSRLLPPDVAQSISIHSLRMEGDGRPWDVAWDALISIHSLRMEGDSLLSTTIFPHSLFQSTPSAWRET